MCKASVGGGRRADLSLTGWNWFSAGDDGRGEQEQQHRPRDAAADRPGLSPAALAHQHAGKAKMQPGLYIVHTSKSSSSWRVGAAESWIKDLSFTIWFFSEKVFTASFVALVIPGAQHHGDTGM